MAIKGTDLLLVHRDGTDYRMEAKEFTVKGEKGEGTTLLHLMGEVNNASELTALSGTATVGDVYRTKIQETIGSTLMMAVGLILQKSLQVQRVRRVKKAMRVLRGSLGKKVTQEHQLQQLRFL